MGKLAPDQSGAMVVHMPSSNEAPPQTDEM
jgi:hypothetical protein